MIFIHGVYSWSLFIVFIHGVFIHCIYSLYVFLVVGNEGFSADSKYITMTANDDVVVKVEDEKYRMTLDGGGGGVKINPNIQQTGQLLTNLYSYHLKRVSKGQKIMQN